MNLKRKFIANKIERLLEEKQDRTLPGSGKAGLIIDAENLTSKLSLLEIFESAGLDKDDYEVVICDLKSEAPEGIKAHVLKLDGITLKGDLKYQKLRDFSKTRFEFLICHFSENSHSAALLTAMTQAVVKIGNKPDVYGLFDIEVDTNEPEIFQQEVLKYLRILKYTN